MVYFLQNSDLSQVASFALVGVLAFAGLVKMYQVNRYFNGVKGEDINHRVTEEELLQVKFAGS